MNHRAFKVGAGFAIALAGWVTLAATIGPAARLSESWGILLPFGALGLTIFTLEKVRAFVTRRAAEASEEYVVRVGFDGIELNGDFVNWSNVNKLYAPARGRDARNLVIVHSGGERAVLRGCSEELVANIEMNYRRFLDLPSQSAAKEEIEETVHYRVSKRPALVRVATNARVLPNERLEAVEALLREGELGDEVRVGLEESLAPEIQAFVARRKSTRPP